MTNSKILAKGRIKKGKKNFPGGTTIPEEKEIRWIKTLEKCQQDLVKLPNSKSPVINEVWQKIEGILGELRAMPGDI